MDVLTLSQPTKEVFAQPKAAPLQVSQGSESFQKIDKTAEKIKKAAKKAIVSDLPKKAKIQVEYPNLREIAKQVQQKLKSANVDIEFEIGKDGKRVIMRIKDPLTGEIVREIPPESLRRSLDLNNENSKEMMLQGLGVDVKY